MGQAKTAAKAEKLRIEKLKQYERGAYQEGYQLVAGIDEVGRGPIAGPVVAAAVILPPDFFLPGVNDSKLVSEKKRLQMAEKIKQQALAWSITVISSRRIDRRNILQATKEAMRTAVCELTPRPDFILVDAVSIPDLDIRQYPIIKGDSLSISIACASIIAKVERDHIMYNYDSIFPGYGLAKHKGYATREHLIALEKYGPSPIHRSTFEPLKTMLANAKSMQPGLFD
ncbi:Ribonuclease HII [bioreactor metagenome]|uniref:Ribonuclease HII n=1 Tax=bioreactor metagenome TaxID=1076179 RepID=A0A645EP50_9ZZZZ|nr:ribonuclease HII [Syntrophomonadaceae bacterium]